MAWKEWGARCLFKILFEIKFETEFERSRMSSQQFEIKIKHTYKTVLSIDSFDKTYTMAWKNPQ